MVANEGVQRVRRRCSRGAVVRGRVRGSDVEPSVRGVLMVVEEVMVVCEGAYIEVP